jgi:hypothetical protein
VIAFFCESWHQAHGKPYAFLGGRDGSAAKILLKGCGGNLEDAKAVIRRYLASSDSFTRKKGWSLSHLSSELNAYLIAPEDLGGFEETLPLSQERLEEVTKVLREGVAADARESENGHG